MNEARTAPAETLSLDQEPRLTRHVLLAESFAESALNLRACDRSAFVDQFLSLAARPVAVTVAGNGDVFRQALCFPVNGAAQGDLIVPVASVSPHLLVELRSGHVIGLRIADGVSSRISVAAFLCSIERSLERLPQGQSAWRGIQKSIEVMQRRRVVLIDPLLESDEVTFWRDYFPKGDDHYSSILFQGLPHMPASGRKQVMAALIGIQSEHYRRATADFVSRLDQDVIAAIRASGLPLSVARYNSYVQVDTTAVRYRIQAMQTIPLFGYILGEEGHRASRLRHMVDAGQPLWPALADTVSVPEETVRWLRGKTSDDVGEPWLRRIPELLRSLALLPPEHRPKTRDDWTAYTDFAMVLNGASTSQRHARWIRELGRLGWIPARQKFAAMRAAPSDLLEITDLLHEITGAVGGELLPHILCRGREEQDGDEQWQDVSSAVETLFVESSILKQMRASLRWHELQLLPIDDGIVPEEAAGSPLLTDWPAPLTYPMKLGGLYAHFLTAPNQLRDEGLRMGHCVGSYASRCLFAGTNIVSLRRNDGRSVSTAELRLVGRAKRLEFEAVQHRGCHNKPPSMEAEQALARLLAALNSQDMQPRLVEMIEQLKARQALDHTRSQWLALTPRAPHRLRALKAALKLLVGYERFVEAGKRMLAR